MLSQSVNLGPMIQRYAEGAIIKALEELYMEAIKRSPVATGTFVGNHRNLGVRKEGDTLIGEIVNETSYAEHVEEGWRQKPVNWHLKDGSIYRSKGSNVYKNSLEAIKSNFFKRLGQ